MKTFTTLKALFTNLSNNTSTANASLGGQLISDQHRYLIERYFDNERTYNTTTVGAQTLTLTGALLTGATTATLSSAWTYPTATQKVNFSSGDQRNVTFTQNSTGISWQAGLTGAATDTIKTIGVQGYKIPPQASKIKNDTITIGQLVYTPAPVRTIQEWTQLNALPYTSNIPNYYFIWNNEVNFFPIPSSTGNLITFNYKTRVPELSIEDYSTGTLSGITKGSNQITGNATAWNATFKLPVNTDLSYLNLYLQITPPNGEGIWYPINSISSDTAMLLTQPIQTAPSSTAASYTIGQLPLLQEDFHDMLVYGALMTYYTAIVRDEPKYKMYENLYKMRLEYLKDYIGSKSINVDLGAQPMLINPNLFIFGTN